MEGRNARFNLEDGRGGAIASAHALPVEAHAQKAPAAASEQQSPGASDRAAPVDEGEIIVTGIRHSATMAAIASAMTAHFRALSAARRISRIVALG
jgi:hypothetical protein